MKTNYINISFTKQSNEKIVDIEYIVFCKAS